MIGNHPTSIGLSRAKHIFDHATLVVQGTASDAVVQGMVSDAVVDPNILSYPVAVIMRVHRAQFVR